MALQRFTEIEAAYDKRNPDPRKSYGIHSADIRMVVKGEKGAVQFLLYTGWYLPSVGKLDSSLTKPMPADLGYHSKVPQWEGQELMTKSCPYCDGGPCYYDGSGLNAEPIFDTLVHEGSEAVWAKLEAYYQDVFGSKE